MIPETFTAVPEEDAGPFMREVVYEERSGRGRWWCPGGRGYTDDVGRAGVFTEHYATDRCSSVRATEVLDAYLQSAAKLSARIQDLPK